MSEICRLNCTNMQPEQIENLIKRYTECGWKFVGVDSGFPPNTQWIVVCWENASNPVFPKHPPKYKPDPEN